jgi:hypothetical protein
MREPMLQIVLWKWEQNGFRHTYTAEHVNVMAAMLHRNLQGIPHRIVCVTDRTDGIANCETATLWTDANDLPNASGKQLPSCYRRLKLYDRETQKDIGIDKGDRIMGIDLDTLITGHLRDVVRTEGRFVGWELKGTEHPLVFNGSLQMFTAGDLQEIWSKFDPKESPREALRNGFRGSDQAWLSYNLVNKPGSVGLKWPLVASYPLQNRIQGILKAETRIIFFHGSEKPWTPNAKFNTPWIARYWRA